MKAFLICLILTPILTYIAQLFFKTNEKKKRLLGIFFSILAILVPSIIAGARNLDVGRDIGMYVTPAINSAKNNTFNNYMANSE